MTKRRERKDDSPAVRKGIPHPQTKRLTKKKVRLCRSVMWARLDDLLTWILANLNRTTQGRRTSRTGCLSREPARTTSITRRASRTRIHSSRGPRRARRRRRRGPLVCALADRRKGKSGGATTASKSSACCYGSRARRDSEDARRGTAQASCSRRVLFPLPLFFAGTSGLIVFLLRCDTPRPQGSICGHRSAPCAPTPSRSFQPSCAKRNSSKRLSIRRSSCTDPPYRRRCVHIDKVRGATSSKGSGLFRHLALTVPEYCNTRLLADNVRAPRRLAYLGKLIFLSTCANASNQSS